MSNNTDLKFLLDKLPAFIQKGNKFCKLIIHKQGSEWEIKYTNATQELLEFGNDLSVLTSRILEKLADLQNSKGYIIKDFHSF